MENIADQNDNKNKDRQAMKLVFMIALSLACCLAAIGSSIFYFAQFMSNQSSSATATALVVATSDAATAQAHATATAVAYTTAVASYDTLDNFESNHLDWYQEKAEVNERWSGTIAIRDGVYVWDIDLVKDPGSFSYRGYDSQKLIQDLDMSVDAKLESGSSDLLCYGVAFRASPRSFKNGSFLFSVCDSGVYSVRHYGSENEFEAINSWTRSQAIRTGDWNTLSVSAHGENIVLSINHTVVSEFSDAHAAKGYIYLLVRIFGDQPGTVLFDNFALQPH
jgi:hypothetical protein